MPLVGDRVRLASRPHRSLRRLLRRRLFASAPPPMVSSRAMHPDLRPRAGATGARFKSSPDASPRCAPDLVALHPRPHLSPPSSPPPPMIPIRSVSLRRSQWCAERQNLLRKWPILKQKGGKSLAGLRPAPRENDISPRCVVTLQVCYDYVAFTVTSACFPRDARKFSDTIVQQRGATRDKL